MNKDVLDELFDDEPVKEPENQDEPVKEPENQDEPVVEPVEPEKQSEEEKAIENPHYLFDSKILLSRLSPLLDIMRTQHEVTAKSVRIFSKKDIVHFRINTGEVAVEVKIPLLNKENIISKEFIFDFKTFLSVISHSGKKFLMRDVKGIPEVSVYDGVVEIQDYRIKTEGFDHDLFSVADGPAGKIDGKRFVEYLTRAYKTMALSSRVEDSKVRLEGGNSYSNFISSIVLFENLEVSGMSLRASDLFFLSKMLKNEKELVWKPVSGEYLFMTTWAKIVLKSLQTKELEHIKPITVIKNLKYKIKLEPTILFRIASLLSGTMVMQNKVNLFVKSEKLRLKSISMTGRKSEFTISEAKDVPDGISFFCPMQTLKVVSALVKNDPLVELLVDEKKRFIFSSGNMKVFLGEMMI